MKEKYPHKMGTPLQKKNRTQLKKKISSKRRNIKQLNTDIKNIQETIRELEPKKVEVIEMNHFQSHCVSKSDSSNIQLKMLIPQSQENFGVIDASECLITLPDELNGVSHSELELWNL